MESDDRSGVGRPTGGTNAGTDRRLVLNPISGTADHAERVHRLADERGYTVVETEHEGHATELAAEAVDTGADLLAVAGGDGTLHEVLRGLNGDGDGDGVGEGRTPADGRTATTADDDALEGVTLGVIPTGTENLFAANVGIEGIEHGFEVIETGERRRVDVGMANGEPFAMSCIAGLLADASVSTSPEMKERFGSLAFVISGVEEVTEFDALDLDVRAVVDDEEFRWTGQALCVLVGNVRKFVHEGGQANVEDGLFDVVIAERMPPSSLAAETIAHRLLGRDTEHVDHLRASRLELSSDEGPITFSADGELARYDELELHARPQALEVCVGPEYEPDPY